MVGLAVIALVLQMPVALPPHAIRLDALLRELSAGTGEVHRAVGTMAGRIVICVGPPRPAAAIRTDLAVANWGHWGRVGREWLLEEDRAGVVARDRARLAGRVDAIRAAQAKLRATARPFDEATAREILRDLDRLDDAEKTKKSNPYLYFDAAEKLLPSTAAVRRLVAGIDPVVLAGLTKGRMAFSDRPNRLQRPLGSDAGTVIREAERGHNLWTSVYAEGDLFHRGRDHYYTADPRAHTDPIAPGGLRAIVTAEMNGPQSIRFSGKLFDARGKLQLQGFADIDLTTKTPHEDLAPTVDPKEPDTPVSGAAHAYSAGRRGEANAADRAVFLAPDRTEPLDVLAGEGCRETAKALKKPLTLWLDDSLLDLQLQKDKGLSPHGWLRALWRRDYVVREDADAIVLQPRHEMGNVDRRVLARLVQTTDRAGFMPFDAAADSVVADPKIGSTGTLWTALEAVLPGAYGTAATDWDFLRLWGGFAPAQRETLRKGGTVPWIAVSTPLQNGFIEAMLQSGPNDIRVDYRKGVKGRDIDEEPSEVLATGVGMADGVTGSGSSGPALMARSEGSRNEWSGDPISPYSLARATVARQKEPGGEHGDGLPSALPSSYLAGRQFSVGFRVPLGTTMVWSRSASGGEFDLRSRPASLDAQSAEFRSQYQEALETLRKQP